MPERQQFKDTYIGREAIKILKETGFSDGNLTPPTYGKRLNNDVKHSFLKTGTLIGGGIGGLLAYSWASSMTSELVDPPNAGAFIVGWSFRLVALSLGIFAGRWAVPASLWLATKVRNIIENHFY